MSVFSEATAAIADASVSAAKDLLRVVSSQALVAVAVADDAVGLVRQTLARYAGHGVAGLPTRADARRLAERVDALYRATDGLIGGPPRTDRPA